VVGCGKRPREGGEGECAVVARVVVVVVVVGTRVVVVS